MSVRHFTLLAQLPSDGVDWNYNSDGGKYKFFILQGIAFRKSNQIRVLIVKKINKNLMTNFAYVGTLDAGIKWDIFDLQVGTKYVEYFLIPDERFDITLVLNPGIFWSILYNQMNSIMY